MSIEHAAHDLEGRLRGFTISDILQLLSLSGQTGTLTLRQGWNARDICFEQGRLTYITAATRLPSLGELLLRSSKIDSSQLRVATASAEYSQRGLAATLVGLEWVQPSDIRRCQEQLLEETVYSLFLWRNCRFSFDCGIMKKEGGLAVDMATERLIIDGTRRVDEWISISPQVPSMRLAFRRLERPPVKPVRTSAEAPGATGAPIHHDTPWIGDPPGGRPGDLAGASELSESWLDQAGTADEAATPARGEAGGVTNHSMSTRPSTGPSTGTELSNGTSDEWSGKVQDDETAESAAKLRLANARPESAGGGRARAGPLIAHSTAAEVVAAAERARALAECKEPEVEVLDLLDGRRDVIALGLVIGQTQFEVAKSISRLVRAGLAEAVPPDKPLIVQIFRFLVESIYLKLTMFGHARLALEFEEELNRFAVENLLRVRMRAGRILMSDVTTQIDLTVLIDLYKLFVAVQQNRLSRLLDPSIVQGLVEGLYLHVEPDLREMLRMYEFYQIEGLMSTKG